MLKNRTFIGVICIIAAIALCFGISPLMSKVFEETTDVVILRSPILQGQIINQDNIRIVEMGSYNLPEKAISDPGLVVGKYAVSNLFAGSMIYDEMLSDVFDSSASVLRNLEENERAMSITIRDFANGFSGKLEMGDIISVVSVNADEEAIIYDELEFVEVLTMTTATGADFLHHSLAEFEAGEVDLPVVITLILQDELQALRLAECENTSLHAVFVCRDEDRRAQVLEEQLAKIEKIKEENERQSEPITVRNTSRQEVNSDEQRAR